ncbi:MAG TPA: hypothetical protein VGO53_16355 [Steroidobacteraceae bacterium]|jgi:hypothetical protein|nr:hypothetical protein [Steroidobacteraceae bacterium]
MTKVCLILTVLLASSCATTQSAHPVTWPAIVQCTAPAEGVLLDKVVAILLGEGGDAQVIGESAFSQLETIAQDKGPEAVLCMVNLAVASLTPASVSTNALTSDGSPAAAGEPKLTEHAAGKELASLAAAQRGRDFLRRAGTTVETEE